MEKRDSIRVFVVDDSAVARQTISRIIKNEEKHLKVVGTASNGKLALEKLKLQKYETDVIITDIIMQEMGGIELITHIMNHSPIPVIAISSFKNKKEIDNALTSLGIELTESGAVEFVEKPDSRVKGDFERFERQLIKTIIGQAQVDLIKSFTVYKKQKSSIKDEYLLRKEAKESIIRPGSSANKIIVMGSSTGGPKAISFILSQLKSKSPPVLIVQHMPKEMVATWCLRLQKTFPKLKISLAKNGGRIQPNQIYIAPGGFHCTVDENKVFRLLEGQKINYVIPAIDVLFSSAANAYGKNVLGIVLTGMGNDGSKGARDIKKRGGIIIAEHESTSVIHSMPKAVIKANLADKIIPLHRIPSFLKINSWVG